MKYTRVILTTSTGEAVIQMKSSNLPDIIFCAPYLPYQPGDMPFMAAEILSKLNHRNN